MDYPVILVGSDGQHGMFDQEASRLDRGFENVHWLGHVSDDSLLHALWQNCGVYFHGHSVGGTNPALVQAMALGAPIVARDTEFNREVLGDSAPMVRPVASEIERAVLRLMSDEEAGRSQSRLNLERARELYSWESVCQAYENELAHVVSET
jgi:glycosyltransferase involved in cell wall biosynthesis